MTRACSFLCALSAAMLLLVGLFLPAWQLRTPNTALFPPALALAAAWAALSLLGRPLRVDSVLIRVALLVGLALYLDLVRGVL